MIKRTKNKMNKNAQLGLIIIIAIVIFSVLILFFFMISSSLKNQEETINAQVPNFEVIPNQITSCLTNKLEYAIYLSSIGGGLIFNLPENDFFKNSEYSVEFEDSYVLYYIKNDNLIINSEDPEKFYPTVLNFPYTCPDGKSAFNETYNNFSNPNPECNKTYSYSSYSIKWEPENKSNPYSMIRNIEKYLNNVVLSCIPNEDNFPEENFPDFEIITEDKDPKVNVYFGINNINAELIYPIKIKRKGTNEIKEYKTYNSRVYGRFNQMFQIIDEITKYETNNAKYEPTDINSEYYSQGFEISIIRFNETQNFSDVIIIKDNETQIYNKPYEIRIARENRPPLIYSNPWMKIGENKNIYSINMSCYNTTSLNETVGEIEKYCNEGGDIDEYRNLTREFFEQTDFIKAIDPDKDIVNITNNINEINCTGNNKIVFNITDGSFNISIGYYFDY